MVDLKITHVILFVIVAFLLYHLIGGCGCSSDGFSVGGKCYCDLNKGILNSSDGTCLLTRIDKSINTDSCKACEATRDKIINSSNKVTKETLNMCDKICYPHTIIRNCSKLSKSDCVDGGYASDTCKWCSETEIYDETSNTCVCIEGYHNINGSCIKCKDGSFYEEFRSHGKLIKQCSLNNLGACFRSVDSTACVTKLTSPAKTS